jgi:hypothetical protein
MLIGHVYHQTHDRPELLLTLPPEGELLSFEELETLIGRLRNQMEQARRAVDTYRKTGERPRGLMLAIEATDDEDDEGNEEKTRDQ